METWEKFKELFTGSDVAFGEWDKRRTGKEAATHHGKPTDSRYREHLGGQLGLGIVPVNSEGLCRFGALDIDVDTINHQELYKEVSQRQLPLHVCRSKSGGAHLYIFTENPISASQLQAVLGKFAALLNYPRAEIFPKQKRSTEENVGNWINLPYFGGDTTTRYAVGPDGARTLAEFLDSVSFYDPQAVATAVATAKAVMPPCLQRITAEGATEGSRNTTLFNYAVFFRKSSPNNWQELVLFQNSQYFSPPLETKEAKAIITSVSRRTYQYTCEQSPLKEYCDRVTCLTLPYGVGHMPWEEAGAFASLNVRDCRKLLTTPPKYIVNVNDHDVTLSWEEFFVFSKFRSQVGQTLNIVVGLMKQQSWETQVRALLQEKTDIEAPDDASTMGMVIDKLHDFLVLRERATEREDILRGLPIQEGENALFRMIDFKRYLSGFKLDRIEMPDLFLALRTDGGFHKRVRLNGRMTMVWCYPLKQVNEQVEAFKVPDFKSELDEV